MRLKKVKVVNGFQHGKLEFEFGDFNSIVGPNGCGKSNLLELIAYALTGKFHVPGTKDTMVKEGQEKGKVTLWADVDGEEVEISAAIGKSNRSLKRGDLKIGKSAEVLDYIKNNLLKTEFDIVNQTSIIRQQDFTKGLFDSPSVRMAAFMRLAGLNDIEKKREVLLEEKTLRTPPMMAFNVEEAQRTADDYQARIDALEKETAEIEADLDNDTYKQYKAAIDNVDRAAKLAEDIATKIKQLDEAQDALDDAAAAKDVAQANLDEVEKILSDHSQAYKDALSAKSKIVDHNNKVTKKQEYQKALQEAKGALMALKPVPDTFDREDELTELETVVAEAVSDMRQKDQASKMVEGKSQCPTCQQNIADSSALLHQLNTEAMDLQLIVEEAKAAVAAVKSEKEEWQKRYNDYTNSMRSYRQEIDSCTRLLESMDDVGDEIMQADEFNDIIDVYEDAEKEAAKFRGELRLETEKYSAAESNVNSLTAEINTLKSQMPEEASALNLDDMRDYVAAYDEANEQVLTWKGEIKQLKERVESERERIENMETAIDKVERMSAYTQTLEFARTVLKRDAFPAGKVSMFIERVLMYANTYLETLEAGFSISFDTATGFIANKHSTGVSIRADRLSGGEKVTFAIAFRFAVNQIRSETGFIILDEPTNHLDESHIDRVAELLSTVKERLAQDVQVIVVTHSDKVAAVADKRLEMDAISA